MSEKIVIKEFALGADKYLVKTKVDFGKALSDELTKKGFLAEPKIENKSPKK